MTKAALKKQVREHVGENRGAERGARPLHRHRGAGGAHPGAGVHLEKFCVLRGNKSACSSRAAARAFEIAFAAICGRRPTGVRVEDAEDSGCLVRADRAAWTVYYCAMALCAPRVLHPQAFRLAARFLMGSEEEKFWVASTVLKLRGLPPPAGVYEPGFCAVRDFPLVLGAFGISAPMPPGKVAALFYLDAEAVAGLRDGPWAARNRALHEVEEVVLELEPPVREVKQRQGFTAPEPRICNNLAALTAKAFQSLEGGAGEPAYAFNVMDEKSLLVVDRVAEAWFVEA